MRTLRLLIWEGLSFFDYVALGALARRVACDGLGLAVCDGLAECRVRGWSVMTSRAGQANTT
eukprot:5020299-Prymnesium_polylepis.1